MYLFLCKYDRAIYEITQKRKFRPNTRMKVLILLTRPRFKQGEKL
jgi:hypothetical protein